MKNILYINACVRQHSRTRQLAEYYLKRYEDKEQYQIRELKLEDCGLLPMNAEMLSQRDQLIAAGDYDHEIFAAARAFAQADEIVLAAPYWDLSFPASVKVFIEHITVCGLTFVYTDQGYPKGLCKAGSFTYITSSGGQIGPYDYGYQYIETMVKGMYGIPTVKRYAAEGLDVYGADVEGILSEVKKEM